MGEQDEIAKLQHRVDHLEFRLGEHLEELNEIIDQRDRLVLNAAWNIVRSTSSVVALICVPFALNYWFDWTGWKLAIPGVVAGLIVLVLSGMWNDKGEDGDLKKFWRLPRWDARN